MLGAQGPEAAFSLERLSLRQIPGQKSQDDFRCSVRGMLSSPRIGPRRAKTRLHARQIFQHTFPGRTVGQDLLQTRDNIFCIKVGLLQLRDHLLPGDQIDHGKVRNLHPGFAQQVSQ